VLFASFTSVLLYPCISGTFHEIVDVYDVVSGDMYHAMLSPDTRTRVSVVSDDVLSVIVFP
jgi:hypothetical protein